MGRVKSEEMFLYTIIMHATQCNFYYRRHTSFSMLKHPKWLITCPSFLPLDTKVKLFFSVTLCPDYFIFVLSTNKAVLYCIGLHMESQRNSSVHYTRRKDSYFLTRREELRETLDEMEHYRPVRNNLYIYIECLI